MIKSKRGRPTLSTDSLFCLEYVENAGLAKFQPSRRGIQALKRKRVGLRSILLRPVRGRTRAQRKITYSKKNKKKYNI